MKFLKLPLALCATVALSVAAPITYNVNITYANGNIPTSPISLTGSITTDGTIGQINTSNVLNFSLTQAVTVNSNLSALTFVNAPNPNNPIILDFLDQLGATGPGNGIVASSSQLVMLSNSFFQAGGNPNVAFGTSISNGPSGSNLTGRSNFPVGVYFISATGNPFVIGTASTGGNDPVPEPSTVALMSLGLGAGWLAQRKRRATR